MSRSGKKIDPVLFRFIVLFGFGFVVFIAALLWAAQLGGEKGRPIRRRTTMSRPNDYVPGGRQVETGPMYRSVSDAGTPSGPPP